MSLSLSAVLTFTVFAISLFDSYSFIDNVVARMQGDCLSKPKLLVYLPVITFLSIYFEVIIAQTWRTIQRRETTDK